MKCYITNVDLTEDNRSQEHIIPNAFGGKLKDPDLLCKEVNSKFGETIDIALIKSIPIPSILDIGRDRGKNPTIQGRTSDGVKYNLKDNKTATQAHRKPRTFEDSEGNDVIEFPEAQEKQVLEAYARKENTTVEELKKRVNYKTNPEPISIYFDNNFSVIATPDAFQGVVKIATNFYVHRRREFEFIKQGIKFIKGEDFPKGIIQYYYPDENVGKIAEDEFSHILYLKGDYTERILYCYIELFNVHNFIIVLNDNYEGPSFEETYIYDIDNQTGIERKIELSFTRIGIRNLDCPGPDNLIDLYTQRLERLANLKDFSFDRRNIEDFKQEPEE